MKWIACLAGPSQAAAQTLTDGTFTVAYPNIPEHFAAFARVFAAQGVEPREGLALAADNTLPAALTLLYLLEHDYSVLLLPAGGAAETGLPRFCRALVTCRSLAKDDPAALEPERFLSITPNPAGDESCEAARQGEPKLLMRTSGSTGTPKMAVFTHAKLHGNILHCVRRFALSERDRVALPAPLYHMFGLGAAFLPSVAAGAAVDLQKGANLLKFIQRETAFNPSVAFMTPSFANTLLQTRKSARPYRLTVTAGDRFRADRFARYEAAFGPLIQLYGSTELGAVAAGTPDLPLAVRQASAGLPMPDVEFRLQPPGGEEGELWCKRGYGFEGYVDDHGQAVDLGADYRDGWFRTKDFARISDEGYLELLGRSDHSVNRDGLLVFFADLEKTIESLAQVASVAVVAGAEEGDRGKKIVAYCVPEKNSELSAEIVRAYCFEKLPRRAVPDEIHLRDELPLLPNGKIDRIELQNLR